MKNIIPKDTRYVPFTQQNYCCVPACISIVMYRLGIPLVPQELLGYYLGLIVSKEERKLYWNPRTGKRPPTGYGVWFVKGKYEPKLAFKKLKIPLSMTNYPIKDFKTKKEIISFISSKIKKDIDLIVYLGSDGLNNTNNKNGHACVIDKIYPAKNIIRLIDPSSKQAKWREFKIDKFIKAINMHPTRNGRLVELKKI